MVIPSGGRDLLFLFALKTRLVILRRPLSLVAVDERIALK
jgi:hypothetical protein